jgi:hypothetical protein
VRYISEAIASAGEQHSVVMFEDFLLCLHCWTSTAVHAKVFVGCGLAHSARDHGGALASIGIARESLTHTR